MMMGKTLMRIHSHIRGEFQNKCASPIISLIRSFYWSLFKADFSTYFPLTLSHFTLRSGQLSNALAKSSLGIVLTTARILNNLVFHRFFAAEVFCVNNGRTWLLSIVEGPCLGSFEREFHAELIPGDGIFVRHSCMAIP